MSRHRQAINAETAPAPVGPYSHAVLSDGLLFCSGQVALDPATGELVGDTPAAQAQQCLVNLQAVCQAAGAWLHDAVRVTVWLTDMQAFAEVNEAYGAFFEAADPPARVAIEVSALPKGAAVEIDAIVALGGRD
jgi:2-iminobutanoate/2-iminopropanoate deaminase